MRPITTAWGPEIRTIATLPWPDATAVATAAMVSLGENGADTNRSGGAGRGEG